ncbi:MAG: DNA polymerase III subunit delta [Prevotella sp.]|nr:DNA polymerase III subunit delta [Prevotella sp.]
MAEKKATGTTFDTVMHDLRAGIFAPVYVLMGEESYYIDLVTDYIAEHALREEERDFNQTVVFGADVNAGQVADMARRYPMMAERQVVIVKEAQNIKNWERLESYLEKPQPSTVLVIAYKNGKIDGRKKILTIAQKAGVVFESKKKRDYELPSFIEAHLREKGCTIDNKSAQMIAEHIGADLSRLASELDKVVLSMSENEPKKVTPEIVERQIGVSKDFNGFELRSAIAERSVVKANRIINYFDKNPKSGSAFMLIPVLFTYFQNLMLAFYAPNKTNENDLAQWLDLRSGWAAREYMLGMRNYSGMKVMQIIGKIRETDAKSKGLDNPNTSIGELMKELVFFILH